MRWLTVQEQVEGRIMWEGGWRQNEVADSTRACRGEDYVGSRVKTE